MHVQHGQIYTWSLVGWGFVLANGKDLYFLHFSDIVEGADLVAVKQPVEFDVAPALPGKRFQRAVNARIGYQAVASASSEEPSAEPSTAPSATPSVNGVRP
jgi:hypothetical protein